MEAEQWYDAAEKLHARGELLAIIVSRQDFYLGVAQLNASMRVDISAGVYRLSLNTSRGDLTVSAP